MKTIDVETTKNNSVETVVINHSTTKIPAAGFSLAVEFRADDSIASLADIGRIEFSWESPAHANRTSRAVISIARHAHLQEVVKIQGGQVGVLTNDGWVWLDLFSE